MSSRKLTLERILLERHGITFSEDVFSPHSNKLDGKNMVQVPEHVEYIREALLDHDIQVPGSLKSLFEKEQQSVDMIKADYSVLPPQSVFFSIPHNLVQSMTREIKATEDKFEQVAKIARMGREYAAAKVSQETWEDFLRSYIFQSFEDSAIQTSKHGKLFDAWSLRLLPTDFPCIFTTEKTPTGFNRNECVANFSINDLGDLAPIISFPTVHPSTLKAHITESQRLERRDLICFPWALVEVQSATEPAELCYCRAADGAHAALDILRHLYKSPWAETTVKIPPVITFTCSGPEIRVWLSFSESETPKPLTRMICIWAGTLTATWCIVALREIVQNMTFWAARVLKPQISSCISQIRSAVSFSLPSPIGTILSRTAPQGNQTFKSPNIAGTEKTISSIGSGLFSSQHKTDVFRAPSTITKTKGAVYIPFRERRIRIKLPSHDERKPFGAHREDWRPKFGLFRSAQAMKSGPRTLVDKETTRSGDESAAKSPGGQQTFPIVYSAKAEGNNKADDKLGCEDNTLDCGIGELEELIKSVMLNAETQDTNPDTSHIPENKALNASDAGRDDVDSGFFPEYFVYRTIESFHGRSYDATVWDSEGDNDESYITSSSSSESDSEDSNDMSEEDNADDEASESACSHDYDDIYREKLRSERKSDRERAESPSSSFWAPPGQVSKLTLADIDDLMYRATNVISGGDFIQLKQIQDLLEELKGMDLLDATWRSLETWEGLSPNLHSFQMRCLGVTVKRLNDFLASQSEILIDLFKVHHLTMALRKEDLDKTLQIMQKKGEYNLRDLLKSLLRSWDGEKCMEILSNELLGLSTEKFENMLQEAFEFVSSDTNLLGTV
ncbi:uncharacterized protein TRUGW13939_06408 [Talaromyces rugulosus]|uniref:Uncharacterized protein n=1 Tax=Talaromyces rugulosus TaxID=121627 RepID=A0A7H8QZT3_TALRU|nr:uncharacterized protein TRUGW13939_06408 [Talaromyces rugulosus]QKX59276.1 hypothetical protein TRUGW13939_06408 [Talaromyces rugulosus]